MESAITLSMDFSKNTIGTNVAALLQMVSNTNSSQIKLKADYIQMTGTTTFLKALDVGAGGSTVIDGGRIVTGTISADRVDVSNLRTRTESSILDQSANNMRQTWDFHETIPALLFCGESCKLILRSRINQRRDSYS